MFNPIPEHQRMALVGDPERGFRFIPGNRLFQNTPPERVARIAGAASGLFALASAMGANAARDFIHRLIGTKGEEQQVQAALAIEDLEDFGESKDAGLQELAGLPGAGQVFPNLQTLMVEQLERIKPESAQTFMTSSGQPESRASETIDDIAMRAFDEIIAVSRGNQQVTFDTLAPGINPASLHGVPVGVPIASPAEEVRETNTLFPLGSNPAMRDVRVGAQQLSTDPLKARQTAIIMGATQEQDEKKKKELIETINAANRLDFQSKLERVPDPVLAEIQQQRIDVARRPVPHYSQVTRRNRGLVQVASFGEYA